MSNITYADFTEKNGQESAVVAEAEKGYTRIANDLLDAVMLAGLTKHQLLIVMAVWRKTYGYNKKTDWISNEQLESMTLMDRTKCSTAKNQLILLKILIQDGRKIGMNKNISEWQPELYCNGKVLPNQETFTETENKTFTETVNPPLLNQETFTETVNHPLPNQESFTETADHYNPHLPSQETFTGTAKKIFTKTVNRPLPKQSNTKDNITKDKKDNPPVVPRIAGPKSEARRATQFPENFTPGEKHQALADRLGAALQSEFEAFSDFHRSKGSVYRDWGLALNTWLRNSVKFAPRQSLRPIPPPARLYNHIPKGFRG